MNDRLTMIGLDRRALRARAGMLPDVGALVDAGRRALVGDPRAGLVVLSTCERLEVYVAGEPGVARAIRALLPETDALERRGIDAARHLLRVAAGLDSRLPGESHVLGQVRRAAAHATAEAIIGPDLTRLFSRTLRCGKRVRAETALGSASATYASLAAHMAIDHLAGTPNPSLVIIGTGAVAMEVGEALAAHPGARLTIVGRHADRRENLARHLGAVAAPLDALASLIPTLDALITATAAPRPIVRAIDLAGARPGLLFIDLGMPANVAADARATPGLLYRALDDVAPDSLPPHALIAEAEAIVERDLARLLARPACHTLGGAQAPASAEVPA